MALPKTPTKGMRDFLPQEFALRQQVLLSIQKTYENFGFSRIETPSLENIALLTSKQGGDNEKLIFKVLKRGEKLEKSEQGDLCDLGLRYDLTVPLSRFYANNAGQLPSVFKAIQMDSVWRADRPQRGRFRQFVQCDIDVIGEPTNLAETELISATMQALYGLGFKNVTVRLSDRRLLNALADRCRIAEENKSSVFIALDKLDKIGIGGVLDELGEIIGRDKAVEFVDMINRITSADKPLDKCAEELGDCLPEEVKRNIREIMFVINNTAQNGKAVFDVTLVRGMGYYTGTIYEISVDGFDGAVAGGGRYDKMIGRMTGTDVPACGFSIGFERIVMLLQERGVTASGSLGAAVLIDKNLDKSHLLDVMDTCKKMRKTGKVTLLNKIKNFGYQIKQLKEAGYKAVYEYKNGEFVKID